MAIRILFIGLVGSGKSYLANNCAKITDGKVVTFAQEVYRLAEKVLARKVDKSNPGDRELLKLIGTTWGREGKKTNNGIETILKMEWPYPHGYKDVWLDALVREVESFSSQQNIFNDDTRFFNELQTCTTKLNFIPVYVACSESTRIDRLFSRGELKDPNEPSHKSEQLVNEMRSFVLNQKGFPVIWNDLVSKPSVNWCLEVDDFTKQLVFDPKGLETLLKTHYDPKILSKFSTEVRNG